MSNTQAGGPSPQFDLEFDPRHGEPVEIIPGVRRLTASNTGPLTFRGTNTYIIGFSEFLVLDPGPADAPHIEAIRKAASGGKIRKIAATHTHIDHTEAVHPLKEETGAELLGEGPHRLSRPLLADESNPLDAAGDKQFNPDRALQSGDIVEIDGLELEAVETPGHCANHLVFALRGTDILFSGDHVMSWSTSIVAPPDGAMSDYMASLELMLGRAERRYLPGHGGIAEDGRALSKALRTHRIMRETAILNEIERGTKTIRQMVEVIYRTTPKSLHGAAALSVLAHIEDLLERGRITSGGPARLDGEYRLSR